MQKIPPALAAWSFNFSLEADTLPCGDTTCFSSVEFQFLAIELVKSGRSEKLKLPTLLKQVVSPQGSECPLLARN